MASDPLTLPAELRTLLERIDSFEKIEVMCHALRHEGLPLTAMMLADAVRLSHDHVATAVDELVQDGLLREGPGGTVTYVVRSGDQDAALRSLARLYDDDRVLVVRALTQVAMDRLRSSAARTFADAFVVRRKKEPDDG